MTVEYERPATPADILLWDGRFTLGSNPLQTAWGLTPDVYQPLFGDGSFRWTEDAKPELQLTAPAMGAVRLNSPSLLAGGGEYWLAMHLAAPLSPARETTTIANCGGVLVELSDSQAIITLSVKDEAGTPITETTEWNPDTDHVLLVHALMSDDPALGYLQIELDGEHIAGAQGVTWSMNMPRAWMVSLLNLRDDVSSGSYTVRSRGAVVANSRSAAMAAFSEGTAA